MAHFNLIFKFSFWIVFYRTGLSKNRRRWSLTNVRSATVVDRWRLIKTVAIVTVVGGVEWYEQKYTTFPPPGGGGLWLWRNDKFAYRTGDRRANFDGNRRKGWNSDVVYACRFAVCRCVCVFVCEAVSIVDPRPWKSISRSPEPERQSPPLPSSTHLWRVRKGCAE